MTELPTTGAPNTASAAMVAGLARLWVKFLPEIEQRMVVLETAAKSLGADSLSATEREASHAAAHKLAGILGTFGLHRGTDLARKAELLLAAEVPVSAESDLSGWLVELRSFIEERKIPVTSPGIVI